MYRTIKILHEGAIAFYNIEVDESGDFTAHLLQYSGRPESSPPQELFICQDSRLRKQGTDNRALQEDIVHAIELSQLNNDLLFSPRKNYYE